ncbi:MAG: hypothetical protein QOH78_1757, partial [Verrucomicrobiota bacterium]
SFSRRDGKVTKTDLELGDTLIRIHHFLGVLCDLRVDRLFLIAVDTPRMRIGTVTENSDFL